MPDVTPAGPLSVALDALRTLIANSALFQTWTGSANAAAALKRIFIGEVGYRPLTLAVASNIVTIKFENPHNLAIADVITLEGVASDIDGERTVASVPDASTITIALTASDRAEDLVPAGWMIPCARPFAVVMKEADSPMRAQIVAAGGEHVAQFKLEILIEAKVSSTYANDPRNAEIEADNGFGQFIQGLLETTGTGDYILLNEVEPIGAPRFVTRQEIKTKQIRFERWQALIRVSAGLES